ncbi:MAG: putative hydro-lyase [Bacillota bacterium]
MEMLSGLSPGELRNMMRRGELARPTAGMAGGYVQANLVVVPRDLAFDFLLFTHRNPKPCPLLDVTDPGSPEPRLIAPGADVRYDLPKYRIYRHGELVDEVSDIGRHWAGDLVAFLLGCSFTFEEALLNAGVPVRHIEEGRNVPMYNTGIPLAPAGPFHGFMVVSMRPVPSEKVVRAVQVTSRFPAVHGAPVHIGDPGRIGIKDINTPDYGDPVTISPGEVPVFWACGVTPQAVAVTAKAGLMITHSPGYMFISDIRNEDLAVL